MLTVLCTTPQTCARSPTTPTWKHHPKTYKKPTIRPLWGKLGTIPISIRKTALEWMRLPKSIIVLIWKWDLLSQIKAYIARRTIWTKRARRSWWVSHPPEAVSLALLWWISSRILIKALRHTLIIIVKWEWLRVARTTLDSRVRSLMRTIKGVCTNWTKASTTQLSKTKVVKSTKSIPKAWIRK